MPKRYTIPFDDIDETDICKYGGKTTNLGLMRKRFPENVRKHVPDGFGVSSDAFLNFISKNERLIKDWISHVREAYKKNNVGEIIDKYREFELELVSRPLDKDIEEEIYAMYMDLCEKEGIRNLDECKVAVRSSAVCEDCATSSLAGRFSSFIDVSKDDLITSVKRVWASAFEPRAILHRDLNDITVEGDKMGVAVQRFVESECAGVMLTSTSADGSIAKTGSFQIVRGIGEDIVQGTKTGDYIEFDKINGNVIFTMESTTGEGCKISDENLGKVITIANSLEAFYGKPQDVEFVIDKKGKLHIVQTRPVVPISTCPL